MFTKTSIAIAIAVALVAGGVLVLPGVASAATTPQTTNSAAPAQAPAKRKTKKKKVQTLQQVNVTSTASLIQRADMQVPTPQVPVSTRVLNLNSQINVGAALNALPYFGDASTPATTGGGSGSTGGNSGVNIRGLGSAHTLVLLDGRRFVASQNLSSVPSILVQGVQVVTGGESATWGSGAVAGVVNIRLRHDLQGLIANGSIGLSDAKDAQGRKFGVAYGTSYGGGKGHVEFGLNYFSQGPVGPLDSMAVRKGEGYSQLVGLPNGTQAVLPGVGFNNAAAGGVITSGVLSGLGFAPNGQLAHIDLGQVVAPGTTIGGKAPVLDDADNLFPPQHNYSFLGLTHYQITDNLQAYAQVQHNSMWANHPWFSPPVTGITINADNAFLQPSIRNALMNAGENSFQMGYLYNDSISDRPILFRRGSTQVTFGLKGTLADDWHWNAYASYGYQKNDSTIDGWPLEQNWLNAVDSVISPTTGAPICRVALADPSTPCVPIDLFGVGNASKSAIDYIVNPITDNLRTKLDVVHFEIQGEPFDLPAGPVSIAAGVDYRHRSHTITVNAAPCEGLMMTINFCGEQGSYSVKEGFGEVFAPLVKHFGVLNNFNFDGAFRYSDYTTSGPIWSWKGGFINTFGGGISGRVDFSRDIRAPNIDELFTTVDHGFVSVVDPETGLTLGNVPENSGGNPNLKPEKADTFTAGLLWNPPSLPSINASVDFYDIKVSDIITALGAQTIVNQCFEGNASLCDNVIRNTAGNITLINANDLNVGSLSESGIDLDFSYKKSATLFKQQGEVDARFLATWVHNVKSVQAGVTTNYLGSMSTGFGMPRWKGVLSVGFYSPKFTIHGRARYLSRAQYLGGVSGATIVNNDIGAYVYFDAGASYNFTRALGMYFDVLNISNKLAPLGMWQVGQPAYDYMGRYYTLGFRVRMR